MTTAVVVTSIVTTNLGEAKFVDHVLEQIRRNDRDLLNKISAVDMDARVVTAILNVNEFMQYAHEWLRQRQDEEPAEVVLPELTQDANKTTVVTNEMSEADFMDYTLAQLRTGKVQAFAQFTEEELASGEEPIGEDFSRQPFLY